jgi:hypothetical protein
MIVAPADAGFLALIRVDDPEVVQNADERVTGGQAHKKGG